MTAPKRVQRKRTAGWRMPENTVYVGRPTKWGNPFRIDSGFLSLAFGCRGDAAGRRAAAVVAYREWIGDGVNQTKSFYRRVMLGTAELARVDAGPAPSHSDIRSALRGKNLACWCRLDQPCHADALLEIANAPQPATERVKR